MTAPAAFHPVRAQTGPHPDSARRDRVVGSWLLISVAMVVAMAVIGAITRLTGSGLSMVEWRPVLGFLPPLGEAAWQRVFDLYRATPEYQQLNYGMSLADFKGIFWWEYIHRVWGRLIGLVFALPFAVFAWRGWLSRRELVLGGLALLLGAGQGYLGWYMVQSGLVAEPRVSPFRLSAHLLMAVGILALLLWLALDRLLPARPDGAGPAGLRRSGWAVLTLTVVTVLAGALVAGHDAGLIYNSFPDMAGQLIADGAFELEPWWLNPLLDLATVQFQHRWLGVATAVSAVALGLAGLRLSRGPARILAGIAAAIALVQLGLGIATLVLQVPVPLAALHQLGALLLVATLVAFSHQMATPLPAESAATPPAHPARPAE